MPFDFSLSFRPFGPTSLVVNLPKAEDYYLVISPEFITCQDNPAPDIVGRYGFGYAILNRAPSRRTVARSTETFNTGFQLLNFDLDNHGQSTVELVVVTNRPKRILDVDLNPFVLGMGLADLMSLGLLSRLLTSVSDALQGVSLRLGNVDPVTAYISLANGLTAGISNDQLCISMETLEKEMLLHWFNRYYDLIVRSIVSWRHTRDWLERTELSKRAMSGAQP